MKHTGDRLKVIYRVSPGVKWVAFHPRAKFSPGVNFTPLAVKKGQSRVSIERACVRLRSKSP